MVCLDFRTARGGPSTDGAFPAPRPRSGWQFRSQHFRELLGSGPVLVPGRGNRFYIGSHPVRPAFAPT